MKCEEAATESQFKKSKLIRAAGIEYYDAASNSFFFLADDPTSEIIRKPGRGSKNAIEWEPLTSYTSHMQIELWKANQEGREVEIKQPWEEAIAQSVLRRCYRITDKGHRMIRTAKKNTWLEWGKEGSVQKQSGVFKQYDGWLPMKPDDEYANYDLDGPGHILHGPPLTDEEKAAITKEVRDHNEQIRAKEEQSEVPIVPMRKEKIAKASAKRKESYLAKAEPTYTPVSDEVVAASATIAQSLTEAMRLSDDEKTKDMLAVELVTLAKNFSWHLREDRGKWRNRS